MEHDTNSTNDTNGSILGTHRAIAIEWAWDTAPSGDECIAVKFKLLEGRPGYEIEGRLYFDTEKTDAKGRTAADRSLEAMRAMGFEGGFADLSKLDADPSCLTRGEVNLVIEENAKGYPAVKFINAPRQSRDLKVFNAPDAARKGAFFAKMAARGAALDAKMNASGARPIGQPRAAAPQPTARPVSTPQGAPRPSAQNTAQQPPRMQGAVAPGSFGDDDIPFDVAPGSF